MRTSSRRRPIITSEEKLERARAARAALAAKRSAAAEREQLKEIKRAWDSIPEEKRRIFDYIRKEIASGSRAAEDVAALRETRRIHFTPHRRKEATPA